ncbi:hypothetical protein [Luteipulveratus mongoliensis]|uniref:Uncharacterized protein n=1 Tax=Luteipulveratus mongoliensis TaxID=571913 RepID=A0A0K1JDK3_9MICO|nr:hypothetical protein [Luteipulveratus mongoliensis]AKU14683.1 hypothetical protein VV02_00355 [Luteipulveratus mongoliensis]
MGVHAGLELSPLSRRDRWIGRAVLAALIIGAVVGYWLETRPRWETTHPLVTNYTYDERSRAIGVFLPMGQCGESVRVARLEAKESPTQVVLTTTLTVKTERMDCPDAGSAGQVTTTLVEPLAGRTVVNAKGFAVRESALP